MLTKLKTTTLAAVTAAATLGGAGSAAAFDANGPYSVKQVPAGCGASGLVQLAPDQALVRVYIGNEYAGGSRWVNGSVVASPPLTPAGIAAACGQFDVTIETQNGADNGSFALDDYVGVIWTAREQAGGPLYRYEMAVVGVGPTNTVSRRTIPNSAPTADAGPDQSLVSATAPVTLDGAGSSDPDLGQTLTYAWTQTAGPAVTLSDATAASPTFTAPTLNIGDPDAVLTFSLMVTDNLGEPAAAADTVTITVTAPLDTTPPTVELTSTTTTLTGTDPFTITATFNEDVTGFDDLVNDVTITNGTVTGITMVSATVYTLAVTPTGAGDVEITVPAAAAQDAAANDNTASNTLVIGDTTVEITQEAIAGFMLGRANNLASNQPGLTRFLTGDGCGAFNANATEAAGSINGCIARGNTWAEITSSWGGGNSYALASFGAHGFVNPNLLVGGMVQFDHAKDDANNASGSGYMIGPYFVAQVPDQPLYFEGRLLYGQTDNKISPLGTYTDSFETERWLAQLRATGEYKYNATTLMPLLDFTYTDDAQKAYTDSLGNTIPGQTVSLMQLTAGMDFSTPLPVQTGALELTGGLSGIYSASAGAAAAPEFENLRGRTHLGLNYAIGEGVNMSATTFYDGIGTDYESYGASFGFDMKF
jgi:hypothetical protein